MGVCQSSKKKDYIDKEKETKQQETKANSSSTGSTFYQKLAAIQDPEPELGMDYNAVEKYVNNLSLPTLRLMFLECYRMITRHTERRICNPEHPILKVLLTPVKQTIDYTLPTPLNLPGVYTGDMVGGVPNGLGEFVRPGGVKWSGKWLRGGREGWMVGTFPDGEMIEGLCVDNRREGCWSLTMPNNQRVTECLTDDNQHGPRLVFFPDGEIRFVLWENNIQSGPVMGYIPQTDTMYMCTYEKGKVVSKKVRYYGISKEEAPHFKIN